MYRNVKSGCLLRRQPSTLLALLGASMDHLKQTIQDESGEALRSTCSFLMQSPNYRTTPADMNLHLTFVQTCLSAMASNLLAVFFVKEPT